MNGHEREVYSREVLLVNRFRHPLLGGQRSTFRKMFQLYVNVRIETAVVFYLPEVTHATRRPRADIEHVAVYTYQFRSKLWLVMVGSIWRLRRMRPSVSTW